MTFTDHPCLGAGLVAFVVAAAAALWALPRYAALRRMLDEMCGDDPTDSAGA